MCAFPHDVTPVPGLACDFSAHAPLCVCCWLWHGLMLEYLDALGGECLQPEASASLTTNSDTMMRTCLETLSSSAALTWCSSARWLRVPSLHSPVSGAFHVHRRTRCCRRYSSSRGGFATPATRRSRRPVPPRAPEQMRCRLSTCDNALSPKPAQPERGRLHAVMFVGVLCAQQTNRSATQCEDVGRARQPV